MKRAITITAMLLGTWLCLAFAPRADDPIKTLLASLQRWVDIHPQEKVYLHMDKPYYALGDTIWFKAYLTSGSRHKFSAISGALYVDLINEKDSVIKDLKLPVTNGMVMGDIALSDDLRQGSYRLRAYTQWMRNAGEAYYFDRTFTVGNPVTGNVTAWAKYQYRTLNNKTDLTATLTYANDGGKPLAAKNIDYEIVVKGKTVWRSSAKTDTKGNVIIKVPHDEGVNFSGAYIKTSLKNANNETIRRDLPIKAALYQSDVQFFPEGGNLVAGLTSKVGFKVVGVDGLGLAIKGKVLDDQNKEIAILKTQNAGMGSFSLKPETGRSYKAIINFPDGSSRTLDLPKALMEGYVMNVSQKADTVLVRVNSTAIMPAAVNLVVQSDGEVINARSVKLMFNAGIVRLPKKLFPSGIAQFTLFNDANEPQAERIAFIRNDDALQLGIKATKDVYQSKEPIALQLSATDSKSEPTQGFFSVSVTDESKVPVNENTESTIFSNLLLTSDLKGYIERPAYYFNQVTPEVDQALDNLMLTQGYRRFAWKELNKLGKPVYPAEGLGVNITGQVFTLNNKPAPKATVILLSMKARIHKIATADAEGKFKFEGIFLTDSIKFAIQGRSAKGSDKLKIVVDSIPKQKLTRNHNLADISTDISTTLKAYLDNARKQDSLYEKLGMLDKVNRLRQVNINANKRKNPPYTQQGMLRIPEGAADQTYYMKVFDRPTLGLCLFTELRGVIFREREAEGLFITHYPYCYIRGVLTPMAVILDGRALRFFEAMDVLDNNQIEPESVYKVDVIRTPQGVAANIVGVAIMIYTKAGYVRKGYNPSISNITPKGFNKAREFYSPKYNVSEAVSNIPDTRSTIFWDPRVQTGLDGQTTINYFNADGPGTYRVVVEGMNAEGELGRQVFRYRVE